MKNLYKQKRQQGFTIIEVLIVLAIAALILLIVFLAVPALQRNSRNTSRNSDVANLLAGINEYAANNNGALPTTCTNVGASAPYTGVTLGTAPTNSTSEVKLGFFNQGITCGAAATSTTGAIAIMTSSPYVGIAASSTTVSNDYLNIVEKATCSSGASASGSAKAFVGVYQTEAGSGKFNAVCKES